MTKKSRTIIFIAFLLIVCCGFLTACVYLNKGDDKNPLPTAVFNPLNATYTIENTAVTLANGKAVTSVEPKTSTAIFGEPVIGDLNGDGINDAAIMITQDAGGSGTFYYVAAAINAANVAQGTNAVFLGDRIAPQNIEIKNGQIIANYADRKVGDPMTTRPSVGVSTYLSFEGGVLRKTVAATQVVNYLVSQEDTTKYCNGVDMDSDGYRKTIVVKKSTSTISVVPAKIEQIKTVISAATTGRCHDVMTKLNVTENGGVVRIPAIDGWAGVSITMCSCKPQVEVNLLQLPGITKIVW